MSRIERRGARIIRPRTPATVLLACAASSSSRAIPTRVATTSATRWPTATSKAPRAPDTACKPSRSRGLDFPVLRSKHDWEAGRCRPAWPRRATRSAGPSTWCSSSRSGSATCRLCSRASSSRSRGPASRFASPAKGGMGEKLLGGRSARVVVTMGMPALVYRWYFRAHSVKSLERNILGFVGIAPIHRNARRHDRRHEGRAARALARDAARTRRARRVGRGMSAAIAFGRAVAPADTGALPEAPAESETTLLDDPGEQHDCTRWEPRADACRVGRSHLVLGGLYCAACAGAIEQALLREPGVVRAQVNYGTRRAVVTWEAGATRLSAIVAAIRRAGYDAAPDAAAPARALRQAEARDALWRLFVRAVLHDAGDDVRGAALRRRAGRDRARPAAAAAVGRVAPEHSGGLVLRRADVSRGLGRPAATPHRHGPAGRARHRRDVRRELGRHLRPGRRVRRTRRTSIR